jgi:hypothetical protein
MREWLVIGAVALTACGPTTLDRLRAAGEEAHERAAAAQREYEETSAEIHAAERACLFAVAVLEIGQGERAVREVLAYDPFNHYGKWLCKPTHVNTTETAHMHHEQWVFEFDGVSNSYLYFENGKLVAKQN